MSDNDLENLIQRYAARGVGRREFLRGAGALGLTGLTGSVLAACGTSSTTSTSGGTFVLTNLTDPDPIDPALTSHTMSRTFERNVYESLAYYKLGTTDLVPVLAESWDKSADGLTYTFHLRKGVKFQNGAPFTADDVKATFDRDLILKSGVGGSYLQQVSSVHVVDPYTVQIILNTPYVFFTGLLPKIGIASAADIKNHDSGDNAQGWFKDNANGTGPWMLKSYVRGQQYTLVRNPNYWRPYPQGAFDKIIVEPFGDSATQAQLISKGDDDMGSWMAFRDMIQAATSPGIRLFDTPSPMILEAVLNGGREPLNKLKVRQAMLAAFPYDRMASFYGGHSQPATNMLAPSYPGSDASFPALKQDLNKAKQLLAEAGYPGGAGMRALRYVAVQGLEDERQEGLLFQDALKQLGVTVNIEVLPFGTFLTQALDVNTAPDFSPGYEAPETNDPFQWFTKLYAKNGFLNISHFSVPELDATITQAQLEPSAATRTDLLHKAQHLIFDNVFAIPAANFDALYVGPSWLGGFTHDITDLMYDPKFFPMYRKA